MASDDNGALKSLRANDLVFDRARYRVMRRGEVLKVSGLTLAFLRTLMERSPRAVSYHQLYRSHLGFTGDFEAFFERFMRGRVQYGSWFKHVAGWERYRDDPRVLFLTYEELRADLTGSIGVLADFLGWPMSDVIRDRVLERAGFDFMKAHEEKFDPITETLLDQGLVRGRFIREGRSGRGAQTVSTAHRRRFDAARATAWRRPDLELRLPDFLH